jgi:SEC-C motif
MPTMTNDLHQLAWELEAAGAALSRDAGRLRTGDPEPAAPSAVGRMAMAWLPAGDYEQALELWPAFAASDLIDTLDGPLSHALYCRAMQQKLVEFSDAGAPGFTVVAIRIAPFTAWCTERNQQADSADARAEYVAHLTTTCGPDLPAWPPGRNEPCWCGSGVKYKRCCAAPAFVDRTP